MNIERPTSNFEFEKMKKRKCFGIGFLLSFEIGRSMFDVGRSSLKNHQSKMMVS